MPRTMYRARDSEPHPCVSGFGGGGPPILAATCCAASTRDHTTEQTGETLLAAKTASFRPLARACAKALATAALAAGSAQAQEAGQLERSEEHTSELQSQSNLV